MLIAAIAIWLTLILFFVALCRGAASGDGRDTSKEGYPTTSTVGATGLAGAGMAGLVMLEDRPAPTEQDLRARARGAQGRAGQYAAGS
jgi:hypothetical protein